MTAPYLFQVIEDVPLEGLNVRIGSYCKSYIRHVDADKIFCQRTLLYALQRVDAGSLTVALARPVFAKAASRVNADSTDVLGGVVTQGDWNL